MKFIPEDGTESLGEPEMDSSMTRSWMWYPPAKIQYSEKKVDDDEEHGFQRLNSLCSSLQILKVPIFSKHLWGK